MLITFYHLKVSAQMNPSTLPDYGRTSGSGGSKTGSAVIGTLWMMNFRVVGFPCAIVGHWSCPSSGREDPEKSPPARFTRVGSQSVVCISSVVTLPAGTGANDESVPRTNPIPCTPPSQLSTLHPYTGGNSMMQRSFRRCCGVRRLHWREAQSYPQREVVAASDATIISRDCPTRTWLSIQQTPDEDRHSSRRWVRRHAYKQ